MKPFTKKIVLENGREFYGYGFGAKRDALVELVFNTSMVGYQEILSDPSYAGQFVCLTAPEIGNYGVNPDDAQAGEPALRGLVVRDMCAVPSNWLGTRNQLC